MSLSSLFGDDDTPPVPEVSEIPKDLGPPFDIDVKPEPKPEPVHVRRVVKKIAEPPKPEPVPVVSGPVSEERAALRLNTVMRRFLVNGYGVEVMLGKYRVTRRGDVLTGWYGSFLEMMTAFTPTILQDTHFAPIGKTPYDEIGELKSLLKSIMDDPDVDLFEEMRSRISAALTE